MKRPSPHQSLSRAGVVLSVLAGLQLMPAQSAATEAAPIQQAAPPASGQSERAYDLEIDAPKSVADLLRSHLDLARFQSTDDATPITPAELQRLIRAAPEQARGLLETEGHFNARIQIVLVQQADKPMIRIQVEPGPRAVVSSVSFEVQGALQELAEKQVGDGPESLSDLLRSWRLGQGKLFAQNPWTEAKATALTHLRSHGYPTANWLSTAATVNVDANQVALELVLDSGPRFLLGLVRVEGLSRYPEGSVLALSTFKPGTPHSDKLILDFQERLRKVGLFESALVDIDLNPDTASATPVLVKVREATLQQSTVGLGISDNVGARISLEHLNRNAFGSEWMAKNKIELGQEKRLWHGELTSHPKEGGYRNLIATSAEREDAAGTIVRSSRMRVGRSLDAEALERLVFFEAITASTRTEDRSNVQSVTTNTSNEAFSGNVQWIRRRLDSVLLPTKGESLNAQLGTGYAKGGDAANSGLFSRVYGRLTAYRPLGGSWFGSIRLEAGQVFAGSQVGIPDTLLFRAGGDDSVRGYGYRGLGPTEEGVVRSARVLFTSSIEVARPVSAQLPSLWWATFIDAGNAADRWRALHPQWGYGLGLRWRSPIGPVRLDLAYAQATERLRLHFSMGVSF